MCLAHVSVEGLFRKVEQEKEKVTKVLDTLLELRQELGDNLDDLTKEQRIEFFRLRVCIHDLWSISWR